MRFTAIVAALAVTATAAPASSSTLEQTAAALGRQQSCYLLHCVRNGRTI